MTVFTEQDEIGAASDGRAEFAIGVVGGMGTYATIDYFKRIADAFPADKEWERPRILIDNRCTMPSRVRAILYGERREELVDALAESTRNLLHDGASHVFYACNTSHVFLEEVYEAAPETRGRVVDMISLLADGMKAAGVRRAQLLATEGTVQTGIYQERFSGTGIDIVVPDEGQQVEIRSFLEAVKAGMLNAEELHRFADWAESLRYSDIILGCTELPVIWSAAKGNDSALLQGKTVYDPVQSAIDEMVRLYRESKKQVF